MTTLYRCFTTDAHARSFLAGDIWFGLLDGYRTAEGAGRRDQQEGQGRVREMRDDREALVIREGRGRVVNSPGEVNVHSSTGNTIFVCCFTHPQEADWDRVREEFGQHVVEVLDFDRLVADIRSSLPDRDLWQRHAAVAVYPIDYDKGILAKRREGESEGDHTMRRAIAQKAPDFAYQAEQRIALITMPDLNTVVPKLPPAPPGLMVRIGHELPYASLIRTPMSQVAGKRRAVQAE